MAVPIRILAACCRAGQMINGVQKGPLVLLNHLAKQGEITNIYSEYIHDNEFNIGETGYIKLYNKKKKKLSEGIKVLTIGGDHSVGRATVAAAAAVHQDNLHVIWVDAHADIHTPTTSLSGNTHGMPVSDLLGLTNMMKKTTYLLKPSQITYIGLRDVEKAEESLLTKLNMRSYTSQDVLEQGIEPIMKDILESQEENTKFHISLDVDALDHNYMFSTGTIVDNGLTCKDVSHIIESTQPNLVSADLVEFNPEIGTPLQIKNSTNTAIKLILNLCDALKNSV